MIYLKIDPVQVAEGEQETHHFLVIIWAAIDDHLQSPN